MASLKLEGEDFTTGESRFLDRLPTDPEASSKIYVKLRPAELATTLLAQLDTGSPWSILETEIADAVGLFDAGGEPKRLISHGLTFEGHLVRVAMLLLADDGDSLEVDATVFVSRDWPSGNFIGYSGLLESIRIALDPQANRFHFGPAGEHQG